MAKRMTMGDYIVMDRRRKIAEYNNRAMHRDDFYRPLPQRDSYNHDGWWLDDEIDEDEYYESPDSKKIDQTEALVDLLKILKATHKELLNGYREAETDDEEEVFLPSSDYRDFSRENRQSYRASLRPKIVVDDYVSSDEEDFGLDQENVDSESGTSQIILHEPEAPKVGEVASSPTTLAIPAEQLFVDFVGTDLDKLDTCKQPSVIINQPLLATIYIQISCQKGVIDVTFGNHTLRLLLFRPTNNPPIMDDLIVINTIDHVYEHTANMLSDIVHDREKFFSCDRNEEMAAPYVDTVDSSIEDEINAFLNADWDNSILITDDEDPEETIRELERLLNMADPELKITPESPPPWKPPLNDVVKIQVNILPHKAPRKRKRVQEHETEMFKTKRILLQTKSSLVTIRLKRSLERFKSKWLGPGDLTKYIPFGVQHEMIGNKTFDGKHTSDPP